MSARACLVGGVVLCGGALVAAFVLPGPALAAWLAAVVLWSGVPVGSLGLALMIRVIGGRWGHALGPILEAGSLTLPVIAVALVPVLIGVAWLYPWVAHPAPGLRGTWMSPVGYALRTALWLSGLAGIAWALTRRRGRATWIATGGLVFLALVGSVVAIDWVVSLSPSFHASGFGLILLAIQFQVALASAIVTVPRHRPQHVATLGALTLTLAMIWTYLAFTGWFIVWSGNLGDIPRWYLDRGRGPWGWAIALVAIVAAATFLTMLLPELRRSACALRLVAIATLVAKTIECAWLVLPGTPRPAIAAVLYACAAAGLGVLLLATQRLVLDRRVTARTPR